MQAGVYALVSQERLSSVLDTLYAITELSVRLIDPEGRVIHSLGPTPSYCCLLKNQLFSPELCEQTQSKAGQRASRLGEAYIFNCHGELNHIAFPLVDQEELLGSVILGPFLLDTPDSTLISSLLERRALSASQALDLYDRLLEIPVQPPAQVQLTKKLMEQLLSPLLPAERSLLQRIHRQMSQQARVNETIQHYKGQASSPSGQLYRKKEEELLSKVRAGDAAGAETLLNELIAQFLFAEGSRADTVRLHAVELTTLLSRAAMEGGAPESLRERSTEFIQKLLTEQRTQELCYLLQEAMEQFMGSILSRKDKGNPYIRRALRYMTEHCDQPMTLTRVAEEVGLSDSYFSGLFHKIVGVSFREQLCRIRVEKSKRLLLSTEDSLSQIALAVGFSDQSYYCRVFRRVVGLTPGRFRGHPEKNRSR